jgi:uncharacterized UPF0160 family protein
MGAWRELALIRLLLASGPAHCWATMSPAAGIAPVDAERLSVCSRAMRVVTHSGPFHADEVFAYALLRVFLGEELELVRTRDSGIIERADLAIDVGGQYDPARGRFDHHQRAYHGPLSSAGMVLNWLEQTGKLSRSLAGQLREGWVDYIDAVDNGRRNPVSGVPCISTIVGVLGEQAQDLGEFDARFMDAVAMCEGVLRGLCAGERRNQEAGAAVAEAMQQAEATGSRVLVFDRHHKWKRAYFEHGGAHHPSDYVLFPDQDGSWRLLGIPADHSGSQLKRPLPSAWAGLVDDELATVVGVPGAKFCHKNRFVAAFATEAAARAAIARWGLDQSPT